MGAPFLLHRGQEGAADPSLVAPERRPAVRKVRRLRRRSRRAATGSLRLRGHPFQGHQARPRALREKADFNAKAPRREDAKRQKRLNNIPLRRLLAPQCLGVIALKSESPCGSRLGCPLQERPVGTCSVTLKGVACVAHCGEQGPSRTRYVRVTALRFPTRFAGKPRARADRALHLGPRCCVDSYDLLIPYIAVGTRASPRTPGQRRNARDRSTPCRARRRSCRRDPTMAPSRGPWGRERHNHDGCFAGKRCRKRSLCRTHPYTPRRIGTTDNAPRCRGTGCPRLDGCWAPYGR
jgi:hypothetical protein